MLEQHNNSHHHYHRHNGNNNNDDDDDDDDNATDVVFVLIMIATTRQVFDIMSAAYFHSVLFGDGDYKTTELLNDAETVCASVRSSSAQLLWTMSGLVGRVAC